MKRWIVALTFTALFWSGGAAAQSFYGYRCTQDCSGHEAGYEWAARKGITNPNDCGGRSNSFIEGCMAYAEQFGEHEDDGDDSEDEYGYGEDDDDDEEWDDDDWR